MVHVPFFMPEPSLFPSRTVQHVPYWAVQPGTAFLDSTDVCAHTNQHLHAYLHMHAQLLDQPRMHRYLCHTCRHWKKHTCTCMCTLSCIERSKDEILNVFLLWVKRPEKHGLNEARLNKNTCKLYKLKSLLIMTDSAHCFKTYGLEFKRSECDGGSSINKKSKHTCVRCKYRN